MRVGTPRRPSASRKGFPVKRFLPSQKTALRRGLLTWFERNQRSLPWRESEDPYHVWLAEVMLQQTQVKTVIPYFERWLRALPTIEAVAQADEGTVLKLWQGLGYYSRARSLHRAARVLVEDHGGVLFDDPEALARLPGIGRYTAAAIASIAFHRDVAVVDGNVARVLVRVLNFRGDLALSRNTRQLWARAEELLPRGRARDFNQALMELGALVCFPSTPRCGECPIARACLARVAGHPEGVPAPRRRAAKRKVRTAVAAIQRGDRVYIRRRPPTGLMAGLWEFPGGPVGADGDPRPALRRLIKRDLGLSVGPLEPLLEVRHSYTRFENRLLSFVCRARSAGEASERTARGRWVRTRALASYPVASATAKVVARLLDERGR